MSTAGQDKFINELYNNYYNEIVSYCTAMTDDADDGEMCARDVFQQAYTDYNKLISHPNVVGWLKLTARNRVNRYLRERSRRRKYEVHITELSENHLASVEYFDRYDREIFDDFGDIDEQKKEVLSKLTEEERRLYELRFIRNLTFKEIAPLIGKSESATRIRTVRLEQRIRHLVAKMFD